MYFLAEDTLRPTLSRFIAIWTRNLKMLKSEYIYRLLQVFSMMVC